MNWKTLNFLHLLVTLNRASIHHRSLTYSYRPQNCTLIYNTLLEGTFGECSDLTKEYFLKCRSLFPLATVFAKDDGAAGNVNGVEGAQSNPNEPLCDGVA